MNKGNATCLEKYRHKGVMALMALVLVVFMIPLTANAGNVTTGTLGDNNITYDINVENEQDGIDVLKGETLSTEDFQYTVLDDGTLEISKYIGNEVNVVIPAKIDGKAVTSIGMNAISQTMIETVEIPETVTQIKRSAFTWCNSLKKIHIPKNVKTLYGLSFNNCRSLEEITVDAENPYYVVEDGILYNTKKTKLIKCVNNKSKIVVPDSVFEIDEGAFWRRINLEEVVIPDSVYNINQMAFAECERLKKVTLPSDLKYITTSTFACCYSLKEINFPPNLKGIYSCGFAYCAFDELNIPETIEIIEESALIGCSNLSTITVDKNNKNYCAENNILYTKDKSEVLKVGCKEKNVELPKETKIIQTGAFGRVPEAPGKSPLLENVELPEGLLEIRVNAFAGCDNLKEISIPASVTLIKASALRSCSSLEKVILWSKHCSIEESGVFSANSIHYGYEGSTLEAHAAKNGCKFKPIKQDADFVYIEDIDNTLQILKYKGTASDVVIPAKVDDVIVGSIAKDIFSGKDGISKITILSKVCEIGDESVLPKEAVLCGYQYSTIKDYAQKYGRAFETVAGNVFKDVKENNWQYTFAKYALDNNLMSGKGKDAEGNIIFDPNNKMTRAEFVQTLYNKEGKPVVTFKDKFTDVKSKDWFASAIIWASENNIVSGKNDKFDVSGNIARQEIAVILYKYAKYLNYDVSGTADLEPYADDEKVASWAKDAMKWAISKGIMSGKGNKGEDIATFKLDPTGDATRAECAAMLKNFMEAY